jgi:Tol biopolymer transport system component
MFSSSQNGLLAYLEDMNSRSRELIWVDRSGKKVGEVAGAEAYNNPRISPDGKRLTFSLSSSGYDIWSYDLARGIKTRLTFGIESAQANLSAVWSHDGQRIAYASIRGGKYGFYQKAADGSGNEEVLLEGNSEFMIPNDWSPDGKFLAYQQTVQGMEAIWMLPLSGERKPYAFLHSQFRQTLPVFSPNGKWLAYCSTESGERNVYVVPFPGPGGRWQVSPGGGWMPRWRRDSRELFYLAPGNKVMAAEVKENGPSFGIGAVNPLFEAMVFGANGAYDVTADGQRFIISHQTGQPNALITLVENWDTESKKK